MKFTAILLLSACLTASATGGAQNITLQVKNAPLTTVFESIKQQTGYSFLYKDAVLKKAGTVDLAVKNASLQTVLDLCFKNQPLSYKIFDNTIVVAEKNATDPNEPETVISEPPPPIDVKGRVLNENGEPVRATVTVKGTNNRVTTDDNGNFVIKNVDENATLVITSVSIEQALEVKVNGKADVGGLIVKTKVIEGDEVLINTGFEKKTPNEVVGSYVVINNKTLNLQTGTNILERLDNVTNGLIFNIGKKPSAIGPKSNTNISIRGFSTINASQDPVIVVDNFIYDGDINNINPNDVESITVLKDGAATSIYGVQGGNGVIVITTKKGKFNQKVKVDFNSAVTITNKLDVNSLPEMTSSDYIEVEQFLFSKNYPAFNNAINSNNPKRAITPAVQVFLDRKNNLISAADSASKIDALKAVDGREQFNRYFNQKAVTQQYALNVTGGSENIAWLIGGDYNRSLSWNNTKQEKVNARFSNSYKPFKNMLITLGVYYTNVKASGSPTPGYNSIILMNRSVPYLKFGDENGNALAVPFGYRDGYIATLGAGKLLDSRYYPLEDYKHKTISMNQDDITANLGVTYQFLKWLNFELSYQYQKERNASKNISDVDSWEARDFVNQFSIPITNPSGTIVNFDHKVLPLGGIVRVANSVKQSQNFRGQLNFKKTFGNHSFSAIAGVERRETIINNPTTNTFYGYNADPLSYGVVDFVNNYQTIFGGFQTIPGSPTFGLNTIQRFIGVFGNGVYNYKGRYSVYLSGRRDGANIFGASTNDRWKPLWSAGIGWNLSKEKFYNIEFLPILSFKGSIGYSGNIDLRRTPYPIAAYTPSDPNTGFPFAQITALNDPSLRWEQNRQINLQVDFSTKNQIVSGSIATYFKRSTDLYGLALSDYTAGGSNTVIKNVANLNGNGVDIEINTKNIDRVIKWDTRVLVNFNRNEVTKYFGPAAQSSSSLLGGGITISPVVGKPLYGLSAYTWGGLNNLGNPQGFINGQLSTDYNGIITEANIKGEGTSLKYIGPSTPPVWGSITNDLTYKSVAISLNVSYKFGYYFRKSTFSNAALFTSGVGNIDFQRRWKSPGDELITNIPAMVYTNYPQFNNRNTFYMLSEANILKSDNIRLQFVNVIYSIPKLKYLPKANLQVYLNAANLGILWRANRENLDPDYPSVAHPSKSFTFGFRANF